LHHASTRNNDFIGVLVVIMLIFSITVTPVQTAAQNLNEWKESLFELPIGKYEAVEAEKMINRVLSIDHYILVEFMNQGGRIRLITTNITSDPLYSYLSGVTPRGWEGTGLTWDDVPGSGGQTVLARIGYSDAGMGHGSVNLELHETAHALDSYVLQPSIETIAKLQAAEKTSLFGDDTYFDYPEEYFAEVFTMYHLNDTTQQELKLKGPQTYAFITELIQHKVDELKSVESVPSLWAKPEIEKAEVYQLVTERILDKFQNPITREEFSELAVRLYEALSGESVIVPMSSTFIDTSNPEVLKANVLGIVYGVSADRFSPNTPISRQEIAVMFYRTVKAFDENLVDVEPYDLTFTDREEIAEWAEEAVGFMHNEGILGGVGNNRVAPLGTATREQAIALVTRIFEKFTATE
jgi:hypothetical protein